MFEGRDGSARTALLKQMALTLGAGAAGGVVFYLAGFPAPWLSGPAVSAAGLSLAGAKLGVPPILRRAALIFLGSTMGSVVTPDTLALMSRWPLSLAGLAVCVFAIMSSIAFYLERVHGYDRATARLCAVPGALPYVLALAAESSADQRRVALIQISRLAALLIVLPMLFSALGYTASAGVQTSAAPLVIFELIILIAAGTAAAWAFERLRAPAGALFGPMVAGAFLYGTGLLTSGIPSWLLLPGFVVIGTMVGANFAGTDLRLVRDTLIASIGSVVVGSTVALACALPVGFALNLPLAQIWLAYAPGGVDVMTILALALGLDPAFVGGHHVVRFFGLGLLVPLWMRAYLTRDRVTP